MRNVAKRGQSRARRVEASWALVGCAALALASACGGSSIVDLPPLSLDAALDGVVKADTGAAHHDARPVDAEGRDVSSMHDGGSRPDTGFDAPEPADTGTDSGLPTDAGEPHDAHHDGTSHDAAKDGHDEDGGSDSGTPHDSGPKDTGPTCTTGTAACSSASTCTQPTNPCEVATCVNDCCGTASAPADTRCGAGTTSGVCNGSGTCVGCLTQANCPNPPACELAVCNADTCGTTPVASGTSCSQGTGTVCNGTGQCVECLVVGDCPTAPACNVASCTFGSCTTRPSQRGDSCSEGNDTICDGLGKCVECIAPANCATPPVCEMSTCNNEACGTSPSPSGSACGGEPGTCDGNGDCQQLACTLPSDCPPPASDCILPTCVGSICGTSDAPLGTTCTDNNGRVCDNDGTCVQCNTSMDCPAQGGGLGQICFDGTCF